MGVQYTVVASLLSGTLHKGLDSWVPVDVTWVDAQPTSVPNATKAMTWQNHLFDDFVI